ncbi:MAG: 3D domain-containing protein [Deltaproteobacteria bacterium]|nr:3D domain-containing protein [Deltaproteobacteria bacterium]MBW1719214.1 3D domain-containing protein [Deltaproteobacteria bacterium]MBW1932872.1 3D domain-containing protein [Deltaproteobacteria bacterium]MBW1939064.1 3D domain-containing protein [Deltaproteobacteria bacterium]MBW1964251.1 3D domain-containing protein [Deltaproteobacteria bacterium]
MGFAAIAVIIGSQIRAKVMKKKMKPGWIKQRNFFPRFLMPRDGTIAADTRYYVFGVRMYIPDYGWGVVEDRGSAIKGPDRIREAPPL